MSRSLLSYEAITHRVVTVRLMAKPFNVTLIQAYAPTSGT